MLGLPKATELNKQLPKKTIYSKFSMNTAAKDKFDADISRITIVGEISPQTVKTVTATEDVPSFYVLSVSLKKKDYDERTIAQISKLINQNMLLVLEYQDECRLAIYHTKLIQSEWQKTADCTVTLRGLGFERCLAEHRHTGWRYPNRRRALSGTADRGQRTAGEDTGRD